ncbi:DUF4873 domain-containing protein [Mycobacterium sp. ITM-2016-00318]|uniref:DUF4873 domain-containing protein n=1 Tax=Mycobacterium sp. ITM-2016-00318 TaxID=2099693 RepID=UPI00287FAC94|nr:DUF4873 domain-containing protein [Mycobacterium sp. ITM-2016-00318]WNG92060.1 DUF4873 domain-containing protein [Mycobacterium sp. ITM-2016-00318]
MTEHVYDVAVVGVDCAAQRLAKAGVTDVIVRDGVDLTRAVFDEAAHSWTLPSCRARIVITDQLRSGREDLVPYLGVAVHGAPNYFMVNGSDAVADARLDYICDCLALMRRSRSTRIEVLFSTQRTFHLRGADKADRADASYWQRMAKAAPTAFDLASHIGVADEVYDGPATLCLGDDERDVRVRLSGRLDPIDGRYHWQGTILDALPDETRPQAVTLTIGEQSAEGRITERTQQGGYSVAGVGMPPYALDDVEVVVPLR